MLNVLTIILIIVTIFSIKATNRITNVSLYLDNLRQKESINLDIENIKKLDIELQANKIKAERILKETYTFRNSTIYPNIRFSTTRLDTLGNAIGDLDSELIGDMELIKDLLITLNTNIENTWQHNDDMQMKDDSIDRLEQNLNVLLNFEGYNIQKLIFNLHGKKMEFDKELEKINKNQD